MGIRNRRGTNMEISYTLIRSERKSLSLKINEALEVIVRAPVLIPQPVIDQFVEKHASWIEEHTEKAKKRMQKLPEPTPELFHSLSIFAAEYIPGRVEHYANIMGCRPEGITITAARTRFGSCSSKNRVCFSCLLMRYPKEAIDYVVVHELAHIPHKNHGKAFYALVAHVLPDYKERMALLRE